MLHIPGFPKFYSSRNLTSGRNNDERNGQLEGYSSRQCAFEDLQRCANFKMAARRMWAQKLKLLDEAWQWSYYYLLFPCSISFAESLCLLYFYLLYLLSFGGIEAWLQLSPGTNWSFTPESTCPHYWILLLPVPITPQNQPNLPWSPCRKALAWRSSILSSQSLFSNDFRLHPLSSPSSLNSMS